MIDYYIPLEHCIHNYLYLIQPSRYGIFSTVDCSFILAKELSNKKFLVFEYHYDIGLPHGTIKPIQSIERTKFINNKGRLQEKEEIVFNYLKEIPLKKHPVQHN